MNDEPLIYTSKGNVPIASLEYRYGWTDNEQETTFVEEYMLGAEVVKRSVHVMSKIGVVASGVSASIG